ncbi:uncharacterized protein N7459_002873 [Penicillium hispanicum]|uniref:uncharacterized protein n=1 Tax=Penicillium hispanicum TaxID=1080232 RepID=UPI00254122F4|nr:uncharacterized protein N7459_002873 [Penicillium hispanicum]KAJ5587108.1 hypothetical protein N7459_002873 [Penicillium hispanicum]
MSFLTSARASARQLLQASYAVPATASAFHGTAVSSSLKESDRNREDLPEHYESHKEHQVKTSKEGQAKWKAELASNSEADVKADRGELDSESNFEQMQKGTKHLPNREEPVNKPHGEPSQRMND